MDRKSIILQDAVITRQVNLLRFTAGEKKKVLAILDQLQKDLRLKLLGDLTDFGRARVNKLLKEATAVIDAAYGEIAPVASKAGKKQVWEMTRDEFLRPVRAAAYKDIKTGRILEGSPSEVHFQIMERKNLDYNSIGKRYIPGFVDHEGNFMDREKANALVLRQDRKTQLTVHKEYVGQALSEGKPVSAEVLKDYPEWKSKAVKTQSTDLLGLARHEAQATAQSFAAIGLDAALPTEAALKALVNGSLIEGAPSAAWWSKQSDDLAFKFAAQVRQGIAGNETVQQIVRRVIGSPRLGTPGIMETSRRGATALVHTSIQQVSNDARLATFKANDDIIKGVQQLSTLDSHTTKICIAYSGASWDLEGNPINGTTLPFNGGTPRHWNCRSVLTAITYTYKELGIDIPEAPPGTRASDLGQIPADTSFESFLGRHDAAYVDNLLGPGRAQLWRDGKITLQQLVGGDGRELTLKRLKAL